MTAVAALLISLGYLSHSLAQGTAPPLVGAGGAAENAIDLGDIAVTGFSGTKLQSERLSPTVDPVTKTVLDPDGATLEVLNSTVLGALSGQKLISPSRLSFKARDIGHVFALAFDNGPDTAVPAPALFAAATSAFGLHIVGPDKDADGQPDRLDKGAAGATFMEGQFGALPGGGPGTIWKIDRKTGVPSLFAELQTAGVKNSGPGIGGLAFDPASRTLYASDLDTGLIHRLSIADGTDQGAFDYGVAARPSRGSKPAVKDDGKRLDITSPAFVAADPATWGFTQKERRINALAVHDSRLYFAVAEGPEIWSVGLEADGAFKTDPRFEVAVQGAPSFPVTAIAFDASGRMILAQRGDVQNPADFSSFTVGGPARVLRFLAESPDAPATPELWQPAPEEYAIGAADESRASSGGVALEYNVGADGTLDTATCSGTLVATGSTLGADATAQGLQLSAAGLVRPANVPPKESAIIAWKPELANPQARGYAGGVAVLHSCAGDGGVGFPELAGGAEGFPDLAGGGGGGGATLPDVVDPGGSGGKTLPDVVDPGGTGGKAANLVVTKTAGSATCSPKGGCSFNIEVRNPGATPVDGPIVIDEQIDAPQATLTGEPNAPWTCTKAAPFSCTHPGPVPAGGKLEDMRLVFAPNTPPETKTLRNCAFVEGTPPPGPDTPAPGTAPTPQQQGEGPLLPADEPGEKNGIKVVVKALSPSCASGSTCTWQLTATNTTAAPITGQLAAGLVATFAGAPNVTATEIPTERISSGLPPGTTCEPGPKSICTNPQVTLAPGADVTMTFTDKITVPAGTTPTFIGVMGGVTIETAQGPAGTVANGHVLKGDTGDAGAQSASQCASIALDPNAPAQTGPVVISKKGGGKCTAKGPCAFTISVTNTTNADIPAGFVVAEQIDAPQATLVGTPAAPWSCKPAAPFECTLNEPLKANSTKDLELSFAPNTPPEKTTLKNCAIPITGVGGKADPAAPAKQIAPGKKSEVPPLLRSLVQPAKFTPQSFPARNGLLHLAGGGAGGNIGGVGAARQSPCRKFLRDGFSVRQDNGATVSFAPLTQINSKLFGTAVFISPNGPVQGRVSGTVGPSNFNIVVDWNNGTRGTYTGTIAPGGTATGTNVANNGARVGFTSVAPLVCVEDEACFKYAKDAGLRARVFASEKCGVPPDGRWSTVDKFHLDFCMSVPSNAVILEEENTARLNELRECQARNATNKTRCEAFTNEGVTLGQQFQSLKCPNQPPGVLSTDPAVQMASCLASPTDQFFASAAQARQEHLDLCKKLLAANAGDGAGGGGGGGGGAGGGGGVGDAGGAGGGGGVGDAGGQQPAPEQCATVPIEPDVPATAANGLQISKVVTPGKTCTKSNCSFTITVTNTSAGPLPIKVIDLPQVRLPGGEVGLPPGAKIVSGPTPPWTCARRPPQNVDFECTHPDPLAAGETRTFEMALDTGVADEVAAVQNCGILEEDTFSCANAPVAPQPPPAKQLVLTKNPVTENCSDVGGGCNFVVSITNTGDTDFTDPIAFTDLVSTGDGTPLPNADFGSVQVAGFPDPSISAPFACKAGGGGLTCSTGALKVKIPPKRTITFPMRITPGPAGGATAIKNCAQMQLDQFAEPVCRTMPLVNGAQIRASKVTAAQSCFPECAFGVAIQNYGNIDAPGPFVVDDIFKPEDTIASISGIDGEFNCSRVGQKLVCTSTKTVLKPGEFARGRVTVKTNRFVPESENCFEVRPSANFTVDTAAPNKCITVKQTIPDQVGPSPGPLPPGPLVVEERAIGTTCTVAGPCQFEVTFTNKGNIPYEGALAYFGRVDQGINNVFSATRDVAVHKLGKCSGPPPDGFNQVCDLQNVRLVENGQVSVLVEITPGKSWTKGNKLQHCTILDIDKSAPAPQPGKFGEDIACATWELDPFNVEVSKTGDQVCPPGSNCTFTITLFNPGQINHNAPVTITDKLTGLSSAQIVSITPPLPCATQPTQIPFSCTSPGPVRLDFEPKPGSEFGPRDFVMVVKLPNDASAEQFSNCATVGGDTGTSDESCATVSTKPVTPDGTCTGGMVMTARGCVCPEPSKLKGGVCVGAGGISPAAQPETPKEPPPVEPPPVATAPPEDCRGGMILIEGTCACPEFMRWNGSQCVGIGGISTTPAPQSEPSPVVVTPSCSGGMILVEGTCACPQFMRWNGRQCVGTGGISTTPQPPPPPVVTTPAPRPPPKVTACPSERPVGTFPNCCPQNARFTNGQCQCNPGFEARRGVACRPIEQPQPPKCPPNSKRLRNGQCECLPGFTPGRREVCQPVRQDEKPQPQKPAPRPQPPPQKPTPQPGPQQPPGQKTCPDGSKVFGKFTQCPNDKPQLPKACPPNQPNGTPPHCCPRQMQFRNGQCVDDKCRQGMVGTPPNCACPPGQRFQNDRCRVPEPPKPKPQPPPQPQKPKCPDGFKLDKAGNCEVKGPS